MVLHFAKETKIGRRIRKTESRSYESKKNKRKKTNYTDSLFLYLFEIEKNMFVVLARINRMILPSFTKKRLDISRAKKWQLAIIAWRYYVTIRALER